MNVNQNNCEAVLENVAMFIEQGVKRVAQFEKTALDILDEQNAVGNRKVRESLKGVPGIAILETSEKAFSGWIAAQKSVIDFVTRKSVQFVEGARDPNVVASKSAAALGDLVRKSLQQTLAAQKVIAETIQRHAA